MGIWTELDPADPTNVIWDAVPLSTGFNSIDISGKVGTNVAACVFRVEGFTGQVVAIQENGSTYSHYTVGSSHNGVQVCWPRTDEAHYLLVPTDSNGVIEWKAATTATNVKITIIGYFIPELTNILIDDDVVIPNGWGDHDISGVSQIGTKRWFIHTWQNSNTSYSVPNVAHRPNGEFDEYYSTNAPPSGGMLATQATKAAGNCNGLLILTDENGVYEHAGNELEIYSHYEKHLQYAESVDGDFVWVDGPKFYDDTPAAKNTWYEIDTGLGGKVLAIIRLRLESTYSEACNVGIRKKGDTAYLGKTSIAASGAGGCALAYLQSTVDAYVLVCPTDENGLIEFVYDKVAPSAPTNRISFSILGYISGYSGPSIDSVVPSYLGLRVIFNKPMLNNDALVEESNYNIEKVDVSGLVSCDVIGVVPEPDVEFPTYIDLDCLDLTGGKNYKIVITPDTIEDSGNERMTEGNEMGYVGVTLTPTIQSLTSTSETTMKVVFNKDMANDDNIVEPSRYVFDKGLEVISVTLLSAMVVELKTSEQTPNEIYTLTVTTT